MRETPLPRNATKATLRFETRGDLEVAIKDFSARPWWIRRFYGRPSLRREARAYARLDGVAGVARCHGFDGGDALVLDRLDATPIGKVSRESLRPESFRTAERLLASIHSRGVAIADLHASNVLVAKDGSVFFVDFALARLARDRSHPGRFIRQLMALDRHALARIESRCFGRPEPRPTGYFGALYRSGRRLKRFVEFRAGMRDAPRR